MRDLAKAAGVDRPSPHAVSEPSQHEPFRAVKTEQQRVCNAVSPGQGDRLHLLTLAGALALALFAGWMDLRYRRIPNWLTVPALLIGLASGMALQGMQGLKFSLLGAALGLALLLPFVLLRALGAGDWKLAGALGAFVGPAVLADLLVGSVFVAGVMALALVIYKGRIRQTASNIGHILVSLVTFRLPGHSVTLDNPDALKVPYGVALAATVLLYGVGRVWRLA